MKKLEKWVDVRKKQVREAIDMDVTIIENKELNSYITLKEIKEVTKPHLIPVNGKWLTKLDKNFTIVEYTPLDDNLLYNVRMHINDKLEVLEYYFDIVLEKEIREVDGKKVPFYNDLYLDVIYYTEVATRTTPFILLDDRDELNAALKEGKIDNEQYTIAYGAANALMRELLEGKNKFINRGLKDYYKYRKNQI